MTTGDIAGSDITAAVQPVVEVFESLGVTYRLGGSVVSSALGVPRSTLDVDLVCDMRPAHIAPFVARLEHDYYVDADMIADAIRRRGSFNLVHLTTMLKVDVFVRKDDPWDVMAFSRFVRKPLDVGANAREFDLTTAEDIILHKLAWYRLGGGVSERQWHDVLGVIAVQRSALDWSYLEQWADALGLRDLLERARQHQA
jgi:hypothetical protein